MPVAFNAHPKYYVWEKLEKLVQVAYCNGFNLRQLASILDTPGANVSELELEEWIKDLQHRYGASLEALEEMRELLGED